jgi:hypothetical protein
MQKNLKPIGALLADSWRLYKKHMNVLALISVIPFLFAGVKMAFGPYLYNFVGVPSSLAAAVIIGAFGLLYLIFAIVVPFALTVAIGHADRGEMPDANAVYKKAFSSIIPYLVVILLVSIVTLGGSVLFIIPGIIASIYLSLAMFVFICEDKTGIDALIESAWYVRSFWWDVLARKITLAVLVIIALIVFSAIIGPLVYVLGFGVTIFQFLFNLFVFMIVLPFSMTFYYRMYKDVKHAKSARGEDGAPKKAFALEAEKLFIILIIVAAILALGIFFVISLTPHTYYGMMPYHQYHHRY